MVLYTGCDVPVFDYNRYLLYSTVTEKKKIECQQLHVQMKVDVYDIKNISLHTSRTEKDVFLNLRVNKKKFSIQFSSKAVSGFNSVNIAYTLFDSFASDLIFLCVKPKLEENSES